MAPRANLPGRHLAQVVTFLVGGGFLTAAALTVGVFAAGPAEAGQGPALTASAPGIATAGIPGVPAVGISGVQAVGILAAPAAPDAPTAPTAPEDTDKKKSKRAKGSDDETEVKVTVPGEPSQAVQIILMITVLGAAPAIMLMCTAFTKIVVVLALTRSALGTPTIPPNQVLVGLALFLSLFVMGPTLDAVNSEGITPYMEGTKTSTEAYRSGTEPLRTFMLAHTRDEELALMTKAADQELPSTREDVELRTLIPAFVLSELRSAFIIGFVVFIPFLVIDLVVSAILMSLGMVMLPPSLVSLPFKILLFVLVDGWTMVVTALVGSYQ